MVENEEVKQIKTKQLIGEFIEIKNTKNQHLSSCTENQEVNDYIAKIATTTCGF